MSCEWRANETTANFSETCEAEAFWNANTDDEPSLRESTK